jgi:hypothetical protein
LRERTLERELLTVSTLQATLGLMVDDCPKLKVLRSLTFGQQVAEDEGVELAKYFVETADWRRLLSGNVDVIYGQKGAGKSALYSLLINRASELGARGVSVVAAENVRGATAFQELNSDPPPTEHEFVGLWKMYLLSLVGDLLERESFDDPDATAVISALKADGLMRESRTLPSLLRAVADYVKSLLRPKAVEGSVILDHHTGIPIGFTGKIVMKEPSKEESLSGLIGIAGPTPRAAPSRRGATPYGSSSIGSTWHSPRLRRSRRTPFAHSSKHIWICYAAIAFD